MALHISFDDEEEDGLRYSNTACLLISCDTDEGGKDQEVVAVAVVEELPPVLQCCQALTAVVPSVGSRFIFYFRYERSARPKWCWPKVVLATGSHQSSVGPK